MILVTGASGRSTSIIIREFVKQRTKRAAYNSFRPASIFLNLFCHKSLAASKFQAFNKSEGTYF